MSGQYNPQLYIKIGCEMAQENKNSKIRAIFFCLTPPVRFSFLFFGFVIGALVPTLRAADMAPAPGINATIGSLLASAKCPAENTALMVKDLDRDSVIAGLNQDPLFNPASVCKLLTTAIAYDRFGVNFCFHTQVFLDGPVTPDSGVCKGNLYIRGGADPYFVVERMWLFVQHLSCIGLRSIEGDIVLDDSFLDTASVGPGFDEDDSPRPYEAPVDAVSTNFNCESIWMRPGPRIGAPLQVEILPRSGLVKVAVTAKTVEPGRPNTCQASTQKDGGTTVVTVSGSLPIDAQPVLAYKKVWQTWEYFGDILVRLLGEGNIRFNGTVRRGTVPDSVKAKGAFYSFPSVPLPQVVNSMNKVSNNYMAEMLFKTLSARQDTVAGTWERSAELALSWWKEKGLPGVPRIKNGSGMGDSNRMSARQIVELLHWVWTQKGFFPEYVYSLPIAGVDGTVKSRFKNSRLKGILRAKTGTLNDYGVNSMAGYVFVGNRTFAYALMFSNRPRAKQYSTWELQQKILETVIPEK
jgi:serine-type D-Ala-D-Ala carboxypeptidase/endopeptidase (penicillin-binding protein 4)